MKITKIRTKAGEFGAPVSTELSAIVERMRSDDTKTVANLIATVTLRSRLAIAQGMPRYYLLDADKLPYLMFGATFGKSRKPSMSARVRRNTVSSCWRTIVQPPFCRRRLV